MKPIFALLIAISWSVGPSRNAYADTQSRPQHAVLDMLPDAKTAIAVAKVLLIRIYGANVINQEMPLTAQQKAGIWIVEGSLKKGWVGGVATIKFRASDCRVLYVRHGK